MADEEEWGGGGGAAEEPAPMEADGMALEAPVSPARGPGSFLCRDYSRHPTTFQLPRGDHASPHWHWQAAEAAAVARAAV